MQQPVEFDLEELESRLYSQVFHSTESWDQTPNHPVLNKVPEQRQVSTYSINNQAVNTSRYWDEQTKTIQPVSPQISTEKPTETTNIPITSPAENPPQNDETNEQNVKTVGHVEEYIEFSSNKQNEKPVDFSKDDVHFQENFFLDTQGKLIQQSEIQKNYLNNNNQSVNSVEPFSDLIENIRLLEEENTKGSRFKAKRLRRKLKLKQIKLAKRTKRQLRAIAREDKKQRRLGTTTNNLESFSFVDKFNSIQRNLRQDGLDLAEKEVYKNGPSLPDVYETENSCSVAGTSKNDVDEKPIQQLPKNEINQTQQQQKGGINRNINHQGGSFVILSDSDSENDDVIEVPLPAAEVVCIDSSSESSDTDDSVCFVNTIVETSTINNLASGSKSPILSEDLNVPNSPKLKDDKETSDINSEIHLKSEGEINSNDVVTQISDNIKDEEENKIVEVEVEAEAEVEKDASTPIVENEEKIDEIKSPQQKSTTSINEIEKERAELLCTPDSNTNDFMANDVCQLNKTNFCFNFNLHQDDLDLAEKEVSKSGPSLTDVYETESSCSEAGPGSKNNSYFPEVDFETPIKEIFAEPDLAKFSSFITPIRNRNITNVANSTPDLKPVRTKAGVVSKLDIFQSKNQGDSSESDEYESDPTVLPVKKKAKKKKKKDKKKHANEEETNDTADTTIETESNTETLNKNKKSKKKSKTVEELVEEPDSTTEKLNKSKEKKSKKKNKRKSDQMETDTTDSSSKKTKNSCDAPKNKNDVNETEESLSTKNNAECIEEETIFESFFADDILYEELQNIPAIKNNASTSSVINIDTPNNSPEKSIENFSFMNAFRKENDNETIDISSDSEVELVSPQTNDANTSNMVLNIFSSEKQGTNESNQEKNMVANPFSFMQNFEKLNHNKKSFKDFWTNDMNTFYNESWGHEDYDLNAVQQSMPSDFSKWSVNPADQSPTKGKKRGPMCLRCRDFGHIQYRCPKLHEPVKCNTCGGEDHTSNRCPKSLCTTCRTSTQHHTTSCNNCSNYNTLRCPICNYIGHLSRDCPDLWRRYHLTTRENSTLVKPNQMLKPPNMQWCSNCANRGHSANNCNYFRTDHFPTYPGIQSYTPVYNSNIPSLLQLPVEPEVPVRVFENVNLSQITNYRKELVDNNNKKYLNMIKNLRKLASKSGYENLNTRLNYLHNAVIRNRFKKRNVGELYKISKMLKNSR